MSRDIIQIISVSGYEAVWKDSDEKIVEPVYIFALVEEDGDRFVVPLTPSDVDGGFMDFCDDASNYKGVRLIKYEKKTS